jgi:hypothetical protein
VRRIEQRAHGVRVGSRSGFALPAALLLIVVLTILAASSLAMVSGERRVVDDQTAQLQALAFARSGMERFLAERTQMGFTSAPPAQIESTRVAFSGGYADVVLRLVRQGNGLFIPDLYVLRSRGVKTGGAGAVVAERSIGQYTRWQWPTMSVYAAWTSLSGLIKPDSLGTISGVDACGAATSVAGVAVPTTPGYSQGGGPIVPVGTPNILDLGAQLTADSAITVDWHAITEAPSVQSDVILPSQPWPSPSQWSDPEFWPLILVHGDYTLPGNGRGTLAVTGSLTVPPNRSWDGVVFVGKALYGSDGATINGAIVSGLNTKFVTNVPPSEAGAGNVTYRYHSCNVTNALARFHGLSPYRNATIDNWPSY